MDDDDDDDEIYTSEKSVLPPVLHLLLFLVVWAFQFRIFSAALGALIIFLYHFLRLLSSSTNSDFLRSLSIHCPKSVCTVYKLLGIESETFRKYVVCPKCYSVYEMECCFEKQAGGMRDQNVVFTLHTLIIFKNQCVKNVVHYYFRR